MKKYLMLGLFTLLLLTGCGQQSDLDKLKSDDVFYVGMNSAYWGKIQNKNSALWHEAVNYCQAHQEKPNCGPVMQTYILSNGSTTAPAIGHSGNSLKTPNF